MTDHKVRAELAGNLRALADRIESHPDAPLPYEGACKTRFSIYAHNSDQLRAAVRAFGGEKVADEHQGFRVRRDWGAVVTDIVPLYGACERIPDGTATETKEVEVCSRCEEPLVDAIPKTGGGRVCPAYDDTDPYGVTHDYFPTPTTRTVEIEVPKYRTVCPESLLADPEAQRIEAERRAEHAATIESEQRADWVARQLDAAAEAQL